MKLLIYLFILLNSSFLFSQEIQILDSETKEPVPFVTVVLNNQNKPVFGNYCDEKGDVRIPEKITFDTVTLSCMGYESLTVQKAGLISKKILLSPKNIVLKEVVISKSNRDKNVLLGEFNRKKRSYLGINNENQFACYFENTSTKKIILKSFLFKVDKVKFRTAIRIHLYKKYTYNQVYHIPEDRSHKENSYPNYIPKEDLLMENSIEYLEPGTKGIIEIDLSQYNIEMPDDGIFVGIECLAYYDESGKQIDKVKKSTKFETHLTDTNNYCIRYGILNNLWINTNKAVKIDFEKVFKTAVDKKQLIAPTFGLKVEEID